jgi:hypothetical protein
LASETRRNYRRIVLNFLLACFGSAEIVFTALQPDGGPYKSMQVVIFIDF